MDMSARFALDVQGLGDLRLAARTAPDKALKDAAQQFEALFLDMLLKSMRATTGQGALLDSEESRLFTGLMDQQTAQKLASGRGLGLAELMLKQLAYSAPPSAQKLK